MTRRKKTQAEFLEELKEVHGDSISTEDKYAGCDTKLHFHCTRGLGHKDWMNTPYHILSGQGCPICKRTLRDINHRKSPESFIKEMKSIHGDSIDTDDTYTTGNTDMVFHCSRGLGHSDWKTKPQNILRGNGCPECARMRIGQANLLTNSDFRLRLKKIHGDSVSTSDVYVRGDTKLVFHCNKGLGHLDWRASPRDILHGHGCPECGKAKIADLQRKSNDEFVRELLLSTGDRIQLIDRYYGARTKTKFMCNLCGYTWEATPDNILRGRGCPNCKSSSGEQAVRAILEFNSINYNPQYSVTIKGNIHRLDIVLKDAMGNWCVIQPDGIQHFKPNNYMGGEKEFEHRKQMDRDENKYLPALGVRVLRIPWFWFALDNTFIMIQDFLGYDLKKPDKSIIPEYKKVKDIVYEYLAEGTTINIITKYKISTATCLLYLRGILE